MALWTVDKLDELMRHFDEGYETSHDVAYARFAQHSLQPPVDLPDDPFSPEYRQRYLDLYKAISTKDAYRVESEGCTFDVDELSIRPFPYFSKSMKLASLHFSLMSKLLGMMGDLKQDARILECGFGWGNTTLALAMLGHEVTALDIEERYCEVVRRRAELAQVNIELINAEYLWIETTDQKFDAVCFFESFHHCWEFERLLKAIHRVLLPGGKVYFGAEPINDDFTTPWGVRLDGESLLVARKHGWMELGFHTDFFRELLTRTGWIGRCIEPHFWVASPRTEPIIVSASDERLLSQIGTRDGALLRIVAPGDVSAMSYGLYGPYIELPSGRYRAEIEFASFEPFDGEFTMDICMEGGTVLGARQGTMADLDGVVHCEFDASTTAKFVEIRLLVPGGFKADVKQVSVTALDMLTRP